MRAALLSIVCVSASQTCGGTGGESGVEAGLINAQYLVKGAGASAMAFVDTLLSESPTASIALVDTEPRPGGHWIHAYDFVRLHQSASFYGVASRRLEPTEGDFAHLSSKHEILAYYDAVLDDFLATGRVQWFPLHAVEGRRVRSLVTGALHEVPETTKLVDATRTRVEIPATHPPRYDVEDGVALVPINDLPRVAGDYKSYGVVGGGKTGIDAVLWLLRHGVAPKRISWIVPNDTWMFVREAVTPPFAEGTGFEAATFFRLFDALELGNLTHDSLAAALETAGAIHRIDPGVTPTKFKFAIASRAEVEALRRVRDNGPIVRLGRLQSLTKEADEGYEVLATFERGAKIDYPKGVLFVDCTADGAPQRPPTTVFNGTNIHVQRIGVQFSMSAAAIAYLEARGGTDEEKNRLATPTRLPGRGANARRDLARLFYEEVAASAAWKRDPAAYKWLTSCRLNRARATGVLGTLRTLWELALWPSLWGRLGSLRPAFADALRRVCAAEGGGC